MTKILILGSEVRNSNIPFVNCTNENDPFSWLFLPVSSNAGYKVICSKIGLKSFQVGCLKLTVHFVRMCRPSVEISKISLSQPVDNNTDRKKSKLWIPRGSSERGRVEVIAQDLLSWYRTRKKWEKCRCIVPQRLIRERCSILDRWWWCFSVAFNLQVLN